MTDANDIRTTLGRIADRLARHGDALTGEDAIKAVLVSPLLAALGHDPSDPDLVHIGLKTGDGRADYSVLGADGQPSMLVAITSNPDDLQSQRARSLSALSGLGARVGMLTDGRRHRVHLMTETGLAGESFLALDIGDAIDPAVLLPLSRDAFDVDAAVAVARTTRPHDIAWDYLLEQADVRAEVHDAIVAHLLSHGIAEGRAAETAAQTLARLGRIMRGEELAVEPVVAEEGEDEDRRPLTGDEIAAIDVVREIVGRYVDPNLVVARQAKTYTALNYTDNNRRTICRIYLLSNTARYVGTFVGKDETRHRIQTYADVATHEDLILSRLRELDAGAFRERAPTLPPVSETLIDPVPADEALPPVEEVRRDAGPVAATQAPAAAAQEDLLAAVPVEEAVGLSGADAPPADSQQHGGDMGGAQAASGDGRPQVNDDSWRSEIEQ